MVSRRICVTQSAKVPNIHHPRDLPLQTLGHALNKILSHVMLLLLLWVMNRLLTCQHCRTNPSKEAGKEGHFFPGATSSRRPGSKSPEKGCQLGVGGG